jgi:hypothetical protein
MSPDAANRRHSRRARFAIACGVTFLALVGAETAHRVVRRIQGQPYDAASMRAAFVEARNRATQSIPMAPDVVAERDPSADLEILHPYEGWDYAIVNLEIARQLAAQDRADAARYPILVLGGSVAGGFCNSGWKTFAEEVGRDERMKGRRVAVVNFAAGGYKQPQQVIRLVWLLSLGIRPAAVIEIDGFNEVALGNANAHDGFHPLHPSRSHWLRQFSAGRTDAAMKELEASAREAKAHVVELANFGLRFGLWRSSLAGTLLQRRVRASQNRVNDAEAEYLRRAARVVDVESASGPPIHGGPDAAMSVVVDGWAECSESMRAICEARSIPYLQVLQPTLHDDGAKPVTHEEEENGVAPPEWIEGARIGYPLLRARGERLLAAGLNFVDASRIFADVRETLYFDECHFNNLGMDRFARFVAQAFLDTLPPRER